MVTVLETRIALLPVLALLPEWLRPRFIVMNGLLEPNVSCLREAASLVYEARDRLETHGYDCCVVGTGLSVAVPVAEVEMEEAA